MWSPSSFGFFLVLLNISTFRSPQLCKPQKKKAVVGLSPELTHVAVIAQNWTKLWEGDEVMSSPQGSVS